MLHSELGNISDHLNLSRTELAIFTQLFAKKNQLVARADLMSVLRGRSPHTIDSHIMEIRRKLSASGSGMQLETVRNAASFCAHRP